jgi:Ca2+-binding RTX toxin-like protein
VSGKSADALLSLTKNEGTDAVQSSISYVLPTGVENLTLASGAGNLNGTGNGLGNVIVGNEGDNRLAGMAGADTLTGGAGADTFVFSFGGGKDRIVDFDPTNDVIDCIGLDVVGVSDFAGLMSHAAQIGADTVITFDVDNAITFNNLQLSQLSQDAFLFN